MKTNINEVCSLITRIRLNIREKVINIYREYKEKITMIIFILAFLCLQGLDGPSQAQRLTTCPSPGHLQEVQPFVMNLHHFMPDAPLLQIPSTWIN